MEFLNRNFPDEAALSDLDPFVARLGRSRQEADNEIAALLHDQSKTGGNASLNDLNAAKEAISSLFG